MTDFAKHRFFSPKRSFIAAASSFIFFVGSAHAQSSDSLAAAKKKAAQKKAQETAAQAARPASSGNSSKLAMTRQKSALPTSATPTAPLVPKIDLQAVKPPRSNEFYDSGDAQQAQYERLLDQEIAQLYALSKRYAKSRSRGEYWLRLAERYVEKGQLVGFRAQAEYDRRIADFLAKKTRIKPKLDVTTQKDYSRKAIELYEWFARAFPNDPKVDQSLFFLGYSWFEMGDAKKGQSYYLELLRRFPQSPYIVESNFALGEYYFENDHWQQALEAYSKVIEQKRARLNSFALYKAAWCLYRLNRTGQALRLLERVVRLGKSDEPSEKVDGRRAVNKIRLASEAMKDYVPFYAEGGQYAGAREEFLRVSGDEAQANKMLERLAYVFADSGNKIAANAVFKQLIALNPVAEKAADYQYQIALTYQTGDSRQYRAELENWLDSFGPTSVWAKENAKNAKLTQDTAKLQEATTRNFVLRLHQAAQNSRQTYSQQQASAGYALYAKHFPNSPKSYEMTFFHAELLFDMERHEDAAKLYTWVAENDPKGPYAEKSTVNAMLALEKELPSQKQLDEKRGTSIEPIPLDPPADRFEKAVLRYLAFRPHGDKALDAERRLGVLYYSYNQFDKAIDMFERIIHEAPKSPNAEVAGNLILDIYKLRGDMTGLVERGEKFLADPAIARTKFGQQVRTILEKASYLSAEKLADKKEYGKAAREYEKFASTHGASDLGEAARYKAASNYEKAGDVSDSIRMHALVVAVPGSDPKIKAIQNDSRNDLARLYSQTAQLDLAAKEYQSYAAANPKDPKAINAYYNAGVLYDALGEREEATRNYDAYYAKSQKSDRSQTLFFEAELRRKAGERERAAKLYERYLNEPAKTNERAVQSYYWLAKFAEQSGQASKAKADCQKTIDIYKASKQGVRYAAEARFHQAKDVMAQITALRFLPSEKQQAQAAAQSEVLRKKYLDEMKDVIRYDHAPYIVAALASTGQMFEALASAYSNVPAPPGYSADDAKKLLELTQARANGFRNEAKSSYKTAYEKALELETYGEWMRVARAGLARYDAAATGADAGEATAESSAADWMGM